MRGSAIPYILKREYKDVKIDVLVRDPVAAQIFENNPHINKTLFFDKDNRFLNSFKVLWRIFSNNYDIAIVCFGSGIRSNLLALLTKARRRIGYIRDDTSRRLKKFLLTDIVDNPNVRHELIRNLELLRPLGIEPLEKDKRMFFYLSNDDEIKATKFFAENNLDRFDFVFGIAPGCNMWQKLKRWPAERFAEISDWMKEKYNTESLVFEEWVDASCVDAMRKKSKRGFIRVKELPLGVATAIMKRCKIFICNDNGGMHMAASVGIPIAAVFGPTDAATAEPLGTKHMVIQSTDLFCCPCWTPERGEIICKNSITAYCLKKINTDTVKQAIDKMLKILMIEENICLSTKQKS